MYIKDSPAWRVAYAPAPDLRDVLAVLGSERAAQALANITVAQLHQATVEELAAQVGKALAARVKAACTLARLVSLQGQTDRPVGITSAADAAALLRPYLQLAEQEYFFVLLLNTRNIPIGEPLEISHGSVHTAIVRTGEVFRPAVRANAASIIVAHNHPSNTEPSPSPEDVAVTRVLVKTGELLDIPLLDHLILSNGAFVSLKKRCLGFS